jgi:lysophospholipase L1-like esterase
MFVNTLVLLTVLELGAAAALRILPTATAAKPRRDPASRSPYYQTRDWSDEYWREFTSRPKHRYAPYVLWRMAPYQGALIRVDDQGVRETPGSVCDSTAYTVFFFGGSTAWGLGSPDWGTIPAYLREELASLTGRPVCMRNFGELGWVSTQDLIQLERELQAERIPDLAIFYGGVNDVVMGYQHHEAGLHWTLHKIIRLLEQPEGPSGARLSDLRWRSNLYRLAVRMKARLQPPADSAPPRRQRQDPSDSVADRVVDLYVTNYRMAAALGRAFDFEVEFFWQPNAFVGPKPLTTVEAGYRSEPIAPFFETVTPRAQSAARANTRLHDLTGVFAGQPDLLYVDWHHITPEGNRIVARAIVDTLRHTGAVRSVRRPRPERAAGAPHVTSGPLPGTTRPSSVGR